MGKNEMQHRCPDCGGTHLLVYEKTAWWLNTMEFFCHSVKVQDDDAEVYCTECNWKGERKELIVTENQI